MVYYLNKLIKNNNTYENEQLWNLNHGHLLPCFLRYPLCDHIVFRDQKTSVNVQNFNVLSLVISQQFFIVCTAPDEAQKSLYLIDIGSSESVQFTRLE
jgi:hypothetical protein